MNIIQTSYQKELAMLPTELDQLRELFKRKALYPDEIENLYLLELQNKAQNDVIQIIHQYGDDDWLVLRDIAFNLSASPEKCDLVLITHMNLYTFTLNTDEINQELYNYNGAALFTADYSHLIYSIVKLNDGLQEIFNLNSIHSTIHSHLIYMQPQTKVEAENDLATCRIISKDYLVKIIKDIAEEEKKAAHNVLNKREVFEILERYEKNHPIELKSIAGRTRPRVQLGICCSGCSSFDIHIGQHDIICGCGMHEDLEQAILRTICEYGVIHFGEYLDVVEVVIFLQIKFRLLVLSKY